MRRILLLIMCVVIVISTAACGDTGYQAINDRDDDAIDGIHIYYDKGEGYEYFSPEHNLEYMIQTPSVQYNPKLGHMLAALSDSVYNKANIEKSMLELGFESNNINPFYNDNLNRFIIGTKPLDDGRTLVLIIVRGSDGIMDNWEQWQSNFSADNSQPAYGMNIHRAFLEACEAVDAELNKLIGDSLSNNVFVITGHSRGAATANVLAYKLLYDGVSAENVYCYTFASLNVANGNWNHVLPAECIFNICNDNDPAPSFPADMFVKWEKFGVSYWIDMTGAEFNHNMNDVYLRYMREEKSASAFMEKTENADSRIDESWKSSDFPIEGSWKSVGSVGFGQAQPGSIVTFDGTHCNFYSPNDTYSLYQSGEEFLLECTSMIFSETLQFDVIIIDESNIQIKYGSTTTQLKRLDTSSGEEPGVQPSDFSIVGSWKSVGDWGFGQAQPGATVTFDGEHCNFYSPYDTYHFYQEDGKWKLSCKNVLWQDVVDFTVEIIDNDNINIYYGSSSVTKLKRSN